MENLMITQLFYRDIMSPGCNQQIDEEPLVINCAGYCDFVSGFETHNREGRLDYYLQYVTHGKMRVFLGNEIHEMGEGSFILTKPRSPYRYFLPDGEEMGYLLIHFSGFHSGRILKNLRLDCGKIYTADGIKDRLTAMFEELFSEFTNRQRGFDNMCAAHLTEILVLLSRTALMENKSADGRLRTIGWLHSHFAEKNTVDELAAMEHLSGSRYRSVFRNQTGFSPSEYRTALRISHACDLLLTSQRSIKDISAACGFEDVLYFTRLFRRKMGMPPGKYRTSSDAAALTDHTED